MIFCKNELLLDDEKTSYLLEIFQSLLGIARNGDKIECVKASDDLNTALENKY